MKNRIIKKLTIVCVAAITVVSCAKKLDLFPQNDLTPEKAYSTAAGYKSVLAKIYAGLAITGNQGPAGAPDISGGLDEGSQVAFIRMFFNCQELPTDEAVVAWNDQTIQDFHNLRWTSSDPFLRGIYARPIYNITLINEYLKEATDAKLAERGISATDAAEIKKSRAEARFLRAFNYWVMMDLFGNSTFITEADDIGATLPKQIKRADLFNYIETELKAIDADLAPVKTIEYGRVDQGAAWALLARMYLNAAVYTGTPKYTEAITYAKKVIAGGYSLRPIYRNLFLADNDKQKDEFMFSVTCDGQRTQAYGNTSFFLHCAAGTDFPFFGVAKGGGWFGYRATAALGNLFPKTGAGDIDTASVTGDKRGLAFYTSIYKATNAQSVITDVTNFENGLHVAKYRNIRSDNAPVSDGNMEFSDIDFPVFRLSEMYLIYAEAVLRGGTGGDNTTALTQINLIRARAGAVAFTSADLNLQKVLDERGRELFWEGHRRTDLVRYGLLTTGTYLWPWKGGVASGTAVDPKYNIFPIPAANRTSNPNLDQNTGY
ncbi:MAG: RagB/SusD family nutrient uptake outer membrane protein [Flavobacterium sp.]|nr:RagB/SusD family nutrient uptake outer membrane protein [Flavobacterium sp.]